MSITVRYFSTAGAGAADGTTWANRAALLSSGTFSTVITGFDFTSNSLECFIGPGTYTVTTLLQASSFTVAAPSVGSPLVFHGCDSNGAALTPPSLSWTADQPSYDTSGFPVIATTSNITTVTLGSAVFFSRLISWTATARSGVMVNGGSHDWCIFQNSQNNSSANCVAGAGTLSNCIGHCSAAAYDTIFQNLTAGFNTRATGAVGSSGNRQAFGNTSTQASLTLSGCFAGGVGGIGITTTSTSTSAFINLKNCTIANCGSDGVRYPATASTVSLNHIDHCMITGNGGYGINTQLSGSNGHKVALRNTRMRDNNGGGTGLNIDTLANWPTDLGNYTTDSDDATEYVTPTNPPTATAGDYRIKSSAQLIWNYNFGVSNQPQAGGGTFNSKRAIARAGMY